MSLLANTAWPREAGEALPDEVFDLVCHLAREDFALKLDNTKRSMVFRRLSPRLKSLNLPSFEAYGEVLRSSEAERAQLLSMLTTNLTGFFRENHHFELMSKTFLPRLIRAAQSGRRVRLWSAACSSGPEAYSLGICLLEACPDIARYDVRILATDIDPDILETAQRGCYDEEKLKPVPPHLLRKYFTAHGRGDIHEIASQVRGLVSFGQLNLAGDWPFAGAFDVIFCRNVAIYFDAEVQARLWSRLADRLTPSGLLCIGHSERVSGSAEAQLTSLGKTAYERR